MRKQVVLSILDQAALSAMSLGLNIVLIALASPEQFGHFVLLFSGLIFATSAQNALIFTPLNVLLPGRDAAEQARQLAMLTTINVLTITVAALAGLALAALLAAGPWLVAASALYYATGLMREYARNLFIVRDNVERALVLDGLQMALAAPAIGGLWLATDPVTAVVGGVSIANLLAMLACRQDFHWDLRHFGRHWSEYGEHWRQTRWALQGAAQTEAQTRGYVFFTQAWKGPAALATLQAGRVLLAPLILIAGAWGRVARPRLVALFHREPGASGFGVLSGGIVTVTGASMIYGLVILLFWPLIETLVFKDKYPDMSGIVALWWAQALFASINVALGTLLQARQQFRGLALVGMAGAVGSLLALMALMLTALPVTSALFVLIASELLCGLGYLGLIFCTRLPARLVPRELTP
ncbi:MAG: hypothetical protein KKH72_03265 [Alphaproteobacteria bacterium]|nr:hypothetical protein [Alphaproteobacteria bacterium]